MMLNRRGHITRRSFLKQATLGGAGLMLGLAACSPYPKNVNWKDVPDSEFSIQKFDEWFNWHRLYNGINPILGMTQAGRAPTFRSSIVNGYTPGIDYTSNRLYAAADGLVVSIHEIVGTGRAGGGIMWVLHTGTSIGGIETRYAHLGHTYVMPGEEVKRGQLLADGAFRDISKLLLCIRGNFVDPDNYGQNHSYMNYYDGKTNCGAAEPLEKVDIQRQVIKQVCGFLSSKSNISYNGLSQRSHGARQGAMCLWDSVEVFRYLDCLYEARPQLFPKLPPETFAEYKTEFYANQPIVLTLPLKA